MKTTNTPVLRALSPTVGATEICHAILRRRQQLVGVTVPAVTPTMSAVVDSSVGRVGTRVTTDAGYAPTMAHAKRNPSDGCQARAMWKAPMLDPEVNGADVILGGPKLPLLVPEKVRVARPPQNARRLSYLTGGVSAVHFLTPKYRGTLHESSYRQDLSRRASLLTAYQTCYAESVRSEDRALVKRGFLVKWTDAWGPKGPERCRSRL